MTHLPSRGHHAGELVAAVKLKQMMPIVSDLEHQRKSVRDKRHDADGDQAKEAPVAYCGKLLSDRNKVFLGQPVTFSPPVNKPRLLQNQAAANYLRTRIDCDPTSDRSPGEMTEISALPSKPEALATVVNR